MRVNIDMHGKRTGRKAAQRASHNIGRGSDEGLAGHDPQVETLCLLAFPLRRHFGFNPDPCHLVRFEQWSGSEGVDEHIHASGQCESMRHPHPVQRTVGGALRRVQIEVAIEVQQPRHTVTQATQCGDDRKRDRAVATEHERNVGPREWQPQTFDELGQARGDLAGVLRQWVFPVRAPDLGR
jgi:hypothetical protein